MPLSASAIRRRAEDEAQYAPAPAPAPVPTPAPTPTTAPPSTPLPSPSGVPTPPTGWRDVALTPSTDTTSFLRVANALLPFYNRQDQLNVSTFLGADASNLFQDYMGLTPQIGHEVIPPESRSHTRVLEEGMNPAAVTPPWESPSVTYPTSPSAASMQRSYLSSERASQALNRLSQMQTASGISDEAMGPGYRFIRQALQLLQQLGAQGDEQSMTRAEYEAMQNAFRAMQSQAETDRTLAPYVELANKFLNPTGVNLKPTTVLPNNTLFGVRSRRFFR